MVNIEQLIADRDKARAANQLERMQAQMRDQTSRWDTTSRLRAAERGQLAGFQQDQLKQRLDHEQALMLQKRKEQQERDMAQINAEAEWWAKQRELKLQAQLAQRGRGGTGLGGGIGSVIGGALGSIIPGIGPYVGATIGGGLGTLGEGWITGDGGGYLNWETILGEIERRAGERDDTDAAASKHDKNLKDYYNRTGGGARQVQ